jgi:hypothetical protein
MIDWFVLLMPFAALPIVLLFVFVGCSLDRSGVPVDIPSVTLTFSPSEMASTPKVKTMVVAGKAYVDRTDDIFHDTDFPFSHSMTLTGSALAAGTATIDINGAIGAEEDAWVSCQCKITLDDGSPPITVPNDFPLKHDRDSGEILDFFLLRTGPTNFHLS